ncbi:MAG: hypothetical protein H0X28_11620 [Solirubrobacterales bacterium]|nr:hypothetical protein [Solirubrobacterales bacterium]
MSEMSEDRPVDEGDAPRLTGRRRLADRLGGSRRVRVAVFWIAVIVGGYLQAEYAGTKHPSGVLKIWGRAGAIVALILIVTVVVYGVRQAQARRRERERRE